MIHQFRTMNAGGDDSQFLGQLGDVLQHLVAREISRPSRLGPHQISLNLGDNPLELTQMRNLYRFTHHQAPITKKMREQKIYLTSI